MSKKEYSKSILKIFLLSSIPLFVFLSYHDILSYYFVGMDTLTLIDTSRIMSFRDVLRIFSEPLMNGTEFVDIAKFYRPITTLSYSLDYYVWGLRPFGFHLTDLILHSIVSVLVFVLIYALSNGKHFMAWLGAVIFSCHPLLFELIPATENRQDMLAALFIILSILFLLKHLSASVNNKKYYYCSLVVYAVALGVKEIAVIVPVLIASYFLLFINNGNEDNKLLVCFRLVLPYLIITSLFFLWRTYVLGGLGGYSNKASGIYSLILTLYQIVSVYFKELLYPVDFLFLKAMPISFLSVFMKTFLLFVMVSSFVFVIVHRRTMIGMLIKKDRVIINNIALFLTSVLILSLIGILISLLMSSQINMIIQDAYEGNGIQFITDAMGDRDTNPVEIYFDKVRNLSLIVFSFALFVSAIALIGIYQFAKLLHFCTTTLFGKLLCFLVVWLILPLLIYLLMKVVPYWHMYIPAIPFSVIMALIITDGFSSVMKKVRYGEPLLKVKILSIILAFGLSAFLFINSPLIRKYGGWEEVAGISSMFFFEMSRIVPDLTSDAVLNIYNFPRDISSYQDDTYSSVFVQYPLSNYSIKSWLDIKYPSNKMKVRIINRIKPEGYPIFLNLITKAGEDNNVDIYVTW